MTKAPFLIAALLFSVPALAQEQNSCELQKRQASSYGHIVAQSRNQLESNLAYVMAQLALLRERYAALEAKPKAETEKEKKTVIEED